MPIRPRGRRPLPVALTALAVTALAACGGGASSTAPAAGPAGTSSADLTGVTLRVGDQKGGAQALLDAAGLLKDVPYTITWSQFPSGPPLLEALNAGAIDVGSTGDAPPIFAASQRSRLTIVAASRSQPTGAAILVPKGSPIHDLAGLRGRNVAVAKGSSAHYHLLAALRSAKLSFADIRPSYLQPADALAAFSSGRVDAWVIWDPFTAIAQQTTGATVLRDGRGLVAGLGFVEAAPTALSDAGKEAALEDYVGRLARARAWTLKNRGDWASSWAKVAGLPEQAAKVSVDRAEQLYVPIDDALVAAEQQEADAFAAAGLIPAKVDVSGIVDRRLNDVVTANQG